MTPTACPAQTRFSLLQSRTPQRVGTMPVLPTKAVPTFQRQKTRKASSSSPPRTLPMRIHREMSTGRVWITSRRLCVWRKGVFYLHPFTQLASPHIQAKPASK